MNNSPVFIVDDDHDDREFLEQAWKELGYTNSLKFFDNGEEVLNYLKSNPTVPFLILCDVNLPKMDGFELKKLIEESFVRQKSIPFVFWSNFAAKAQIQKAYDLSANGFFIKETKFEDIKKSLVEIYQYWQKSKAPE
jgi:CheY-like chemotaxis protein